MNQGKTRPTTTTSRLKSTSTSTRRSTQSSSTPIPTTLQPLSQANRSGITLNCLEHGEPVDCLFKITANNETVNEFKELIKKRGELDVFARKLKLWIVNIPFNSQNLGDDSVDIANTLNGQRFLPPNKVRDIFPTQPAEDHVHIIVELPASTEDRKVEIMRQAFEAISVRNAAFTEAISVRDAAFTEAISVRDAAFTEATRQFTKVIERQTKKPIVSLSEMKQTELNELLDHFQLPIVAIDINDINMHLIEDENVQPFSWDGRNENQQANDVVEEHSNTTKEGYINYLKRNIQIPNGSDFYDTKSKKSLLSLKYDELPFEISGTADLVVAKKSHADALTLAHGIQAGFELKKKIQDSHVPQAIGQLFTANIRSNEAVFIVLTDLNDEWIFFWLENRENSVNIMQFRVGLRKATFIIERALAHAVDSPLASRISFHNFREHVRVGGEGNRAFEEVVTGESEGEIDGLELFLNRSKVHLDFEDDVANMKDVYDVMTEEEICNWKIKRVLRLLGETPDFQSFQ